MDFLSLFFPRRCIRCRRLGAYVCPRCAKTLPFLSSSEMICPYCNKPAIDGAVHPRCRTRHGLDGLTCFFRYRGVVRTLIHEMKYRLVSDTAPSFIAMVPDTMLQLIRMRKESSSTVIIPIPMAHRRQRLRGFNQAELIAMALGKRLALPLDTTTLFRTRETAPQATAEKRILRLQNVKNAFSATKGKSLARGVILCDDVYTTGATMKNAASALKRAGIEYVWGVAMAR